jgi:hypothetical protein
LAWKTALNPSLSLVALPSWTQEIVESRRRLSMASHTAPAAARNPRQPELLRLCRTGDPPNIRAAVRADAEMKWVVAFMEIPFPVDG